MLWANFSDSPRLAYERKVLSYVSFVDGSFVVPHSDSGTVVIIATRSLKKYGTSAPLDILFFISEKNSLNSIGTNVLSMNLYHDVPQCTKPSPFQNSRFIYWCWRSGRTSGRRMETRCYYTRSMSKSQTSSSRFGHYLAVKAKNNAKKPAVHLIVKPLSPALFIQSAV